MCFLYKVRDEKNQVRSLNGFLGVEQTKCNSETVPFLLTPLISLSHKKIIIFFITINSRFFKILLVKALTKITVYRLMMHITSLVSVH